MIWLFPLIGAALNVIRGGALSWFRVGKAFNFLAFGALTALYLPPDAIHALADWMRLPVTYGQAMVGQFILSALCMWAGQAPSWGEIVGQEGILGGNRKAHWGALVRGGYWGGMLALATWSPLPLIAGLFLGPCFEVARLAKGDWRIGEALFGAVLWGACYV